jgi:hypothetical protein
MCKYRRLIRLVSMLSALACCAVLGAEADGQSWPQTRAERTDYKETSHYSDVIYFLEAIQSKGAPIDVQFIGTSAEGRRIPMVIAGRPVPASPAEARRLNRPIVCVQANIHAGEVEGKEASLMLLRDLAEGQHGDLLDKLVLIVLPIYNTDGNEKFGPQSHTRPNQFGPEMVGVRANGQGLDLNRDYVRLAAPETKAVLQHVFTTWDPDVYMDLHTTDGTLHGYQLTYSPPLNPDTESGVLAYTRDELLVGVRRDIQRRYGIEIMDYGNVPRRSTPDEPFAWYTNAPEARYGTNYMGMRNRISVLSEAMSHCPFKVRTEATYRFVQLIMEKVAHDAPRVIELTRRADLNVTNRGLHPDIAPALGIRFDFASRGREKILLDKSEMPELRDTQPRNRPPGPPQNVVAVDMDVFDRFKATVTRPYPAAYTFGPDLSGIAQLLVAHGVIVDKTLEPCRTKVESLHVTGINLHEGWFLPYALREVTGTYTTQENVLPAGSYMVRTAQPLGILIFNLLEPEGPDGVGAWNLLGDRLAVGKPYPITKCFEQIRVPSERVLESAAGSWQSEGSRLIRSKAAGESGL